MSAEVASITLPPSSDSVEDGVDFYDDSNSPTSERSPSKVSKSTSIDQKVCGVCGDKALGNNFNAITCESCKAFFRRNALRAKVFLCPFSNNCKVDAVTRRFCQKCRLKKCFDIGMKKEWIMTDEEKRVKKQKIEQNRLKRSGLENSGSGSGNHSGEEEQDVASPPAAKVHIVEIHREDQRSAAGVPFTVGVDGVGLPGIGQETDTMVIPTEGLISQKNQKQPMGPHNQNNTSMSSYSKKCKEKERVNVLTVTVNGKSLSPGAHYIAENEYVEHQSSPIVQNHANLQYDNQQTQHPSISWDDSSSNSSLSNHSSPILIYPPNKRQLVREKSHGTAVQAPLQGIMQDDTEVMTNQGNESCNQMPLLSSLISPGYPESSPDPIASPTVPNIEYDDDVISHANSSNRDNKANTILPMVQTISVIQQHQQRQYPVDSYHHREDIQTHHHHNQHGELPLYDYSNPPHPHQTVEGLRNGMDEEQKIEPYNISSMSYSSGSSNHYGTHGHDAPPMPQNTIDSILSIAIAAEFNAFGVLGSNPQSRELNKAEQAKLNELLLASQALHAPVDAERPIKVSETSDPSLLNVINLTEIAIRRLIKMSKKISGFKNMCQEDQIALLKGGCTEMMILRSAVTYDPDRDSWQIPHSNPGQYNINLGVLKEARGNLYEEHQRFVKSFRAHWRKDENIIIIMCAITLFTPERLNVVHKDVVKLEQDSYYYLLKRYLESILNGCEAKSTYLHLIRKIAELRALNSSHVRVFLEMNPKEVEPLLIEIFDLK